MENLNDILITEEMRNEAYKVYNSSSACINAIYPIELEIIKQLSWDHMPMACEVPKGIKEKAIVIERELRQRFIEDLKESMINKRVEKFLNI